MWENLKRVINGEVLLIWKNKKGIKAVIIILTYFAKAKKYEGFLQTRRAKFVKDKIIF